MTFNKALVLSAALMAMGGTAYASDAACVVDKGRVAILSNDFTALQTIVNRAESCITGSAEFSKNQTTEHRDLQVAALTASPAQYTSAIVANSSIVPLLNAGLIRPLDDLVAKYGQHISPGQLITIDGKVMAVAFMANAQHLVYRADILKAAGVDAPKTYEDVVAAAAKIKEKGLMKSPVALNTKVGWNLGEEFVNMYLGMGGEFFEPGTAKVSINNDKGIAALNMLKALSEHSDPDYLTFDSNATSGLWEGGELALATVWGSRVGQLMDDEGSTPDVTSNTVAVMAPTVGGGSVPASTLWWDGFTISANISDEDAEATFKALAHGISPELLADHSSEAVWLLTGYEPAPSAAGVSATAQGGAKPYPMLPYMGLLHTALGDEIVGFLQGSESAEQALSDVEASYTAAAKEQGFLN